MIRNGCPPLSRCSRPVPNTAAPRSGRGVADAAFAGEMPWRFRSVHLLFSFRTWRSTLSIAAPIAVCASRPIASPWRKCSPRAWSVTSAWNRVLSRVTTTCAETALSLSGRSTRAIRSSASLRTGAGMAKCRAVISRRMRAVWGRGQAARRLIQYLPLVRRRNLELLAVLGDRAARQLEALALQDADDLRVAQRLPRILLLDDLPDPLLDGHRRHRVAVRAGDAAVEEVLHLEHALWRVHVLVGDDAADGGLVHADVVGDVAQHQGAEVFDAVIQEVALEVDDARRDLVDGLLPLLDRLDQPERRAELVFDVGARLVRVLGLTLVEKAAVDRADAQLRQTFLVEHRHVLLLDLDDVHVGDHVLRLRGIEAAAGLRVEVADELDVLLEVVDGESELARELRDLVVLQEPHVLGDDFLGRGTRHAEMPELEQQAFLQVAGGHANRVEALNQLQRLLDRLDRPRAHRRELFDRRDEHPVVIEIADDGLADLTRQRLVGLHRELPEQVVRQRCRRRERVLDRRQLLHLGRRARPVPVVQIVAEEIFVILVVPGVLFLLRLFFLF